MYGKPDQEKERMVLDFLYESMLGIINSEPVLGYPFPSMSRTICATKLARFRYKIISESKNDMIY